MSSAPREEPEPMWTLLLLFGLLFIAGAMVWSYWKHPILEVLRYLRLMELWGISLFTDANDACIHWLRAVQFGVTPPTPETVQWTNACFGTAYLSNLPPDQMAQYYTLSYPGVAATERRAALYLHWPIAGVFALIAVYIFFFSPHGKFKTRHNLESFIKTQARMWPVIAPIVNFKPTEKIRAAGQPVPDQLPPFAEALSPEEWVAWHRIAVTNGIPDREATRRAFLQQLGPRWNGIDGQPPYIRALMAAFALKGLQKREESDNLLGRLSLCWSINKGFQMPGKLKNEVDGVISNEAIGGQAVPIASRHAYRTTALLGVLKWGRGQGGVLAPAQFLWLRAVDRALWYPFNNLGRRSFHTEGAGALAHFMAELNAKKPLPIPRIDTAIVTLNAYLSDPHKPPMPIPPREEPGRSGRK